MVDGKQFKNYSDYPSSGLGQIPFRAALANSCNTAFIGERDQLEDLDLFDAAASLGMGDRPRPRLPGVLRQRRAGPDARPSGAADMIGQGRILASPMTMAAVIASVQAGRGRGAPAARAGRGRARPTTSR